MIRIRVSLLEAFRRVVETSFGDEAALVRSVMGRPDPPTPIMAAGTAWHLALEASDLDLTDVPAITDVQRFVAEMDLTRYLDGNPPDGAALAATAELDDLRTISTSRFGDCLFSENAIAFGQKVQGPGLREVTARKVYDLGGFEVEVQGTADHVRGLFLRDAKTKFSPADPRDYEPSLQWRYYLDLHEAAVFTYDLFAFADPKDGYCQLRDVVSFRFWRYPALEAECREWVQRFVAWAGDRKLLRYLDPAAREAA